jgi:hypothetical protein
MFTFLPFQVNARKFVCGVYVMAYDMTNPPAPTTFRIWVNNVKGSASVSLIDPIQNKPVGIQVLQRQSNRIRLQFQAVEYPRLLVVTE